MRLCDLTFAYTPTSGGIRTYIDQKRRFLLEHTTHEHVLIVPGPNNAVREDGRTRTYELQSPIIPGCAPYRAFVRPGRLLAALEAAQPDVIELGSYFLEAAVAFRYRALQRRKGRSCTVMGYFHTDLARTYAGGPLRQAFRRMHAKWLIGVADRVEAAAASRWGRLFARCDEVLAATAPQARRLQDYCRRPVNLVPLGVDLQRFHPGARCRGVRERWGGGEETIVLLYAGRFDREKQVQVLVKALERLQGQDVRLVMIGDGPERAALGAAAARDRRLIIEPHERDVDAFAQKLASADVYVTAGPYETFGLSVLEAQACGLPVVGVAAGALVERVPAELGRLGPAGDAEAMARNIEILLPDRHVMGAAARRHVVEGGMGWEHTFQRWLDLLPGEPGDLHPVGLDAGSGAAKR